MHRKVLKEKKNSVSETLHHELIRVTVVHSNLVHYRLYFLAANGALIPLIALLFDAAELGPALLGVQAVVVVVVVMVAVVVVVVVTVVVAEVVVVVIILVVVVIVVVEVVAAVVVVEVLVLVVVTRKKEKFINRS